MKARHDIVEERELRGHLSFDRRAPWFLRKLSYGRWHLVSGYFVQGIESFGSAAEAIDYLEEHPEVIILNNGEHVIGEGGARGVRPTAMGFAEKLVECIREAGGPRQVKAWSKAGVGARVYWPCKVGFLSVGQDGSVSPMQRGKRVFDEDALFPTWRYAWRTGHQAYLAWLSGIFDSDEE